MRYDNNRRALRKEGITTLTAGAPNSMKQDYGEQGASPGAQEQPTKPSTPRATTKEQQATSMSAKPDRKTTYKSKKERKEPSRSYTRLPMT